ncbi:uncharacterized protein LOC62_04G005373 [Vanrija pseudolonga]|uniref:Uncharacterized protein n=1 Tax=Vanrija pseudolonga TaxID=143232 RepID=A0AAF1BL73_9TREE|nr:hypothetical protein LOC62_04G005373 [Vanrija pseudolonga]
MPTPSWGTQLGYTLALAAVMTAYCILSCVQVQHWATYRPRGSARISQWGTFGKMLSGKRRPFSRGGPALLFRLLLVGLLSLVSLLVVLVLALTLDPYTQLLAIPLTFVPAWAATYPLGSHFVALVLGEPDPPKGELWHWLRRRRDLFCLPVFLANVVQGAILSVPLWQWAGYFFSENVSGAAVVATVVVCDIATWPPRVAATRIIDAHMDDADDKDDEARPSSLPPYDGLLATCRAIVHEEGWAHSFTMIAHTLTAAAALLDPLPTPAEPLPRAAIPIVLASIVLAVPLGLLITFPFVGAIVRLRADYNPKGVSLADDDPHYNGPQLTGVFSTLRRTIAVEGWYGVYKGWAVALLQIAIMSLVATIGASLFLWQRALVEHLLSYQLVIWALALVVPPIAAFLSLPLYVLQIRAIVTPYRVPFAPRRALRLLLSDAERSGPFALYYIPGLVGALLLSTFLNSLVRIVLKDVILGPNAHFITRPNEPPEPVSIAIAGWRWALFGALSLALVFVLVPLDVVFTKLSVASVLPGLDEVVGESTPLVPGSSNLRLAGEEDDVVGVRPVSVAAYAGVGDAVRRITEEEGTGALFRAWEWTTAGAVLTFVTG